MTRLDSYSRQVFYLFGPHFDLYQSLNCLFEIRKIAVCFLWLSLPGHYKVTDEALLETRSMTHRLSYECFHCSYFSDFIFDFTAAGVVPCGGRKTSPRTSTIVQFLFYFGFEISDNIL